MSTHLLKSLSRSSHHRPPAHHYGPTFVFMLAGIASRHRSRVGYKAASAHQPQASQGLPHLGILTAQGEPALSNDGLDQYHALR